MINVAIVDDEPLARDVLLAHLSGVADMHVAGVCRSAVEAFELMSRSGVDLLFLDINMPGMTGIEFLRTLSKPPLVIFTTAYEEFAVVSYELNAIDYLLKPVSRERFGIALGKARDLIAGGQRPIEVSPEQNKLLFVRSAGKWIRVDLSKVWFVEGLKDYVRIWTEDGRITVHSTMKNIEEQLVPYPDFIRAHKSYIINLCYVTEANTTQLVLKGEEIPVGNSYKDELHKRIAALRLL